METNFKQQRTYRKRFIVGPFFMIAFLLLGGYVVMYLWNAIIPHVFSNVSALTYWQATGLLLLCRILFGGLKGGHHRHQAHAMPHWKQKMMNMTEEEKEAFKANWKARCGHH